MRIIAYCIVMEHDHRALAVNVQDRIKEGWTPYGSLATTMPSPGSECFYQPMVKYEATPEKTVTRITKIFTPC